MIVYQIHTFRYALSIWNIKDESSVLPGSGLDVIEADVIVVSVVETDSDVVPADIIVESGVLVLNGVTERKLISEHLPLKFLTTIYNEPKILISGKKISTTYFKYRSLSFILYHPRYALSEN